MRVLGRERAIEIWREKGREREIEREKFET